MRGLVRQLLFAIFKILFSLDFEMLVYLPKMAQWSYFSFTQDRVRKGIINHRGLSQPHENNEVMDEPK